MKKSLAGLLMAALVCVGITPRARATEQFVNNCSSTLNGGITNVATSLVVTSAACFPTSGTFSILIDQEVMTVTGVSGATFTVTRTEAGTNAAHSSGATVTVIETARGILQLETDAIAASTNATTINGAAVPTSVGLLGSNSSRQLISAPATGVTPGSYTNTNLTVNAQGQLTAASNGTGGQAPNNDITPTSTTISGPTTVVLPASGHSLQNLTMTATATISIPAGTWVGQEMLTNTCQNGTGGFTPTFAGSGTTLKGTYPTPTTTANKCDLCNWIYTSTNIWQFGNCAQNE